MYPKSASWLPILVWLAAVAHAAPAPETAAAAEPCPAQLTAGIPPRRADAVGGTAFIAHLESLAAGQRENAILAELAQGNVPDFLRHLVPVKMSGVAPDGSRPLTATLCVMPDFLAVGSDEDFVRLPLDFPHSTEIARRFGFVLPTRKMVRAIHTQAEHRFRPEPMTPGPKMASPGYYQAHNRRIRAQREQDAVPLGVLVAGHKKTIVLTNRLHERPGRIAIFGWIRRSGKEIQPLSTVHGAEYADYSHGVRLISETLTIDGSTRSIYDVLDDPALGGVLSREGRIRDPRRLMGWPEAAAGSASSAPLSAPAGATWISTVVRCCGPART